MKTLAIRQPWATYIAEGTKTLEIRSWRTHYRGPLLIAASGRPFPHVDDEGATWRLPAQVLVCAVELVDVRPMTLADEALAHVPYAPGLWAWVLEAPAHVRPVPHKGRMMLYETPAGEVALLPDDAHYLDFVEGAQPGSGPG